MFETRDGEGAMGGAPSLYAELTILLLNNYK